MKQIGLAGKCGSCRYFCRIEGTARGECREFPYGDNVYHDPKHPYFEPAQSRPKCKLYRATPQTNADRIRAMTDEELARFIARQAGRYCNYKDPEDEEYERILPWLKSPVEVDNGT